jgi:hypothetical protein
MGGHAQAGEVIMEVLFLRQKTIRRIKMAPPTMPATTPAMVPTGLALWLSMMEELVGVIVEVEALEEADALATVEEGFEEAEALKEANEEALGMESTGAHFGPTINDSIFMAGIAARIALTQTEIALLPQTSKF